MTRGGEGDARGVPQARRRARQLPRHAVRAGSRLLLVDRRRREEARRGELHARGRRPVHDRRHDQPDHAGDVELHDQGRSVLPDDLGEVARDQGARDGDDGADAEREGPRGGSRPADLDLRANVRRRASRIAHSSGCRGTTTRTSPIRGFSRWCCAGSPGRPSVRSTT